MNSTDLESPISSIEAQETANASSTYSKATINCQASTGSKESVGNIENDSLSSLRIDPSPLMIGDLNIPPFLTNEEALIEVTREIVPMMLVPVPESRTMRAIPMSSINRFKSKQYMDTLKDEQQARNLLVWNNGVGTLDGCDLRFKLNQLGCLELLDSDDESENQITPKQANAISSNLNQSSNNNNNNNNNVNNTTNTTRTTTTASTNGLSTSTTTETSTTAAATATSTSSSSSPSTKTLLNAEFQKRAKLDISPAPMRQISPGSSLLRDGPNIRRPKSSSGSNYNPSARSHTTNSITLLKKIEHCQNSILLDKLVPKQRLEEIKTNVEQWTIKDVKNFVDSIPGCSGYGELFELQQICGKSLMYLDQKDLLDVINLKLGPAVKIYRAISLLK